MISLLKFIFKSKHNVFECTLIAWFLTSMYFCLQDQGGTFFVIWEEVINALSIYTIYKTLIDEDNGNIYYIVINISLFIWYVCATLNDIKSNDIELWRQSLYVASDVSMLFFTMTNCICGVILWVIKVKNDDVVSHKVMKRLTPMYGWNH